MHAQEHIPVDEVFEQLKCTREGLTSEEGQQRLQIFGPNKLEEKKANFSYIDLLLLCFFIAGSHENSLCFC